MALERLRSKLVVLPHFEGWDFTETRAGVERVDDHGGSVTVANADGGGALLTRRFDADGR